MNDMHLDAHLQPQLLCGHHPHRHHDKMDLRNWCPHPIGWPHYYFPRLRRCHHDICCAHAEHKVPEHLPLPEHLMPLPKPHIRGNIHKAHEKVEAPSNVVLSTEAVAYTYLEFTIKRTTGSETTRIEIGKRYIIYYIHNAELLCAEGTIKSIEQIAVRTPFHNTINQTYSSCDYILEVDCSELNSSNVIRIPANQIRTIAECVDIDTSFEVSPMYSQSVDILPPADRNSILTITVDLDISNIKDNWSPIVLRSGQEELAIGLYVKLIDGHYRSCFRVNDHDIEDTLCPLHKGNNIVTFIIDYCNGRVTFIVNDEYIIFEVNEFMILEDGSLALPDISIVDNVKFMGTDNIIYVVSSISYEYETTTKDETANKVLRVGKDCDYADIQSAIADAEPGNIIDGSHSGPITTQVSIDKAISITGFTFGSGAKLSIKAEGDVDIIGNIFESDITYGTSGSVKSPLNLNVTGRVRVVNNMFNGDNAYYSAIEFGQNNSLETGSIISNNQFNGRLVNNAINIYMVDNNSNIIISNNYFADPTCNCIKFGNCSNAKANFAVLNNKYDVSPTNTEYSGFMLFQATKDDDFSKYAVNVKYLYYKDEIIDENGTGAKCIYYTNNTETTPNVSFE